jgi:hypothetical protein
MRYNNKLIYAIADFYWPVIYLCVQYYSYICEGSFMSSVIILHVQNRSLYAV